MEPFSPQPTEPMVTPDPQMYHPGAALRPTTSFSSPADTGPVPLSTHHASHGPGAVAPGFGPTDAAGGLGGEVPSGPLVLGQPADAVRPVPVVRVLSPLGVEYVFLTVGLFTAASGLTAALLALVNGKTDFSVLAFPTALLVVGLPVFAGLFLRIKRLELRQPGRRFDPSKRRSTQFTQIVSFLICLFTLVGVVFSIFSKLGGQSDTSIGKTLLDGLVLLVVFGGLLAYYWRDEHREG